MSSAGQTGPLAQPAVIFVHAGAGFHSATNENIHLEACARAAKAGMLVMKTGGSAVDGVEMAIRSMEDNGITNAGFGSNLTVEGYVECDATIVDHLGRSGAVGAMSNVRNPISAARVVYEESKKPMVLRRVPPNLVTGRGATKFAAKHDIAIEPPDALISRAARERFKRWKAEIDVANGVEVSDDSDAVSSAEVRDIQEAMINGPALSRNPDIAALGNESQPFSPDATLHTAFEAALEASANLTSSNRRGTPYPIGDSHSNNHVDKTRESFDSLTAPQKRTFQEMVDSTDDNDATSLVSSMDEDELAAQRFELFHTSFAGGSLDGHHRIAHEGSRDSKRDTTAFGTDRNDKSNLSSAEAPNDRITDTVGAIAIDRNGLIAAGSSSGGIGMKCSGRTGPAALVNVGTAVIPLDPEDDDGKVVACVMSGTGEHMAACSAAITCATRVLTNTKSGKGGTLLETHEDDAMTSFIKKDFMTHPAVQASHTLGAIGTMVAKKTCDGIWIYWAHNTDSFALASMHAYDSEPHTVMSRSPTSGQIVCAGRSMNLSSAPGQSANHDTGVHRKPRRIGRSSTPKRSTVDRASGRSPAPIPIGAPQTSRLFGSAAKLRRWTTHTPTQDAAAQEQSSNESLPSDEPEVIDGHDEPRDVITIDG